MTQSHRKLESGEGLRTFVMHAKHALGPLCLFHVKHTQVEFYEKMANKSNVSGNYCRNLEIRAFCRHADISFFFPAKRNL